MWRTLLALVACASVATDASVVVGYLPDWRYHAFDWSRAAQLHTHIILFSIEVASFNGKWHAGQPTLSGLDRMPAPALMRRAREATRQAKCQLLLCVGGNGRSAGFARMVADARHRAAFVADLVALLDQHALDGVDYNWEYPGYVFGRGYDTPANVEAAFAALRDLIRETRAALPSPRSVTMAYYPDGRQEALIKSLAMYESLDMMHAMVYDQGGAQHSSMQFAKEAIARSLKHLPSDKVTLGVPFYGRKATDGDWVTFEDIVQRHHPLDPALDSIDGIGFNGIATIQKKVQLARKLKLAGVMIWESGQDCRVNAVEYDGRTHVATCPDGEASSFLRAIREAIDADRSEL